MEYSMERFRAFFVSLDDFCFWQFCSFGVRACGMSTLAILSVMDFHFRNGFQSLCNWVFFFFVWPRQALTNIHIHSLYYTNLTFIVCDLIVVSAWKSHFFRGSLVTLLSHSARKCNFSVYVWESVNATSMLETMMWRQYDAVFFGFTKMDRHLRILWHWAHLFYECKMIFLLFFRCGWQKWIFPFSEKWWCIYRKWLIM